MKVLVVDDEPTTTGYLAQGLRDEGYAVDVAASALEANEHVAVFDYDVIVLDVMLPGVDGFSLCRSWRQNQLRTPILFLSALDDLGSKVQGFDLGGDDYLVKPFSFVELLARLRALIRRGASREGSAIQVADLEVDLGTHRVRRDGQSIDLTHREFQILSYLISQHGRVVSRMELWEHVWESGDEPSSNVVDVYVRSLRDKLGREPDLLQTVRGSGYRLAPRDGF